MELNTNFLKTFKTLTEVKSYTKTAIVLHMTQPGVSQHIKWLEEYFNAPLLQKQGKGFELTPEGHKVLNYSEQLFKDHQEFLMTFKEDDPHKGDCRFASPGSFGIKMYSFLLEYNKKFKDLSINYYYAPNTTVEKELLNDDIDVGFMSIRPKDPSLEAKAIDQEKLCLIAPTTLKDTSFESLCDLGFISHPDGYVIAHQLFSLNYKNEYKGMEKI